MNKKTAKAPSITSPIYIHPSLTPLEAINHLYRHHGNWNGTFLRLAGKCIDGYLARESIDEAWTLHFNVRNGRITIRFPIMSDAKLGVELSTLRHPIKINLVGNVKQESVDEILEKLIKRFDERLKMDEPARKRTQHRNP